MQLHKVVTPVGSPVVPLELFHSAQAFPYHLKYATQYCVFCMMLHVNSFRVWKPCCLRCRRIKKKYTTAYHEKLRTNFWPRLQIINLTNTACNRWLTTINLYLLPVSSLKTSCCCCKCLNPEFFLKRWRDNGDLVVAQLWGFSGLARNSEEMFAAKNWKLEAFATMSLLASLSSNPAARKAGRSSGWRTAEPPWSSHTRFVEFWKGRLDCLSVWGRWFCPAPRPCHLTFCWSIPRTATMQLSRIHLRPCTCTHACTFSS